MYTPGQVSKMLNIPPSTLRYWAKIFKDYLSSQEGRRHRIYTEKDLLNFSRIKDDSNAGIALELIGPRLKLEQNPPAKTIESALALVPSIAAEIESANQQSRAALAKVDELTGQLARIAADQASQAAQLARLQSWAALPWWQRIFSKPPID